MLVYPYSVILQTDEKDAEFFTDTSRALADRSKNLVVVFKLVTSTLQIAEKLLPEVPRWVTSGALLTV